MVWSAKESPDQGRQGRRDVSERTKGRAHVAGPRVGRPVRQEEGRSEEKLDYVPWPEEELHNYGTRLTLLGMRD